MIVKETKLCKKVKIAQQKNLELERQIKNNGTNENYIYK
jgi:hypothetical protein